jgi:hypothetical protein
MTLIELNKLQKELSDKIKLIEMFMQLDIANFASKHALNNDPTVIQGQPAHVQAYWLSFNNRVKHAESLTLYRCTQMGELFQASYEPNGNFTLQLSADNTKNFDRSYQRSWLALRWPRELRSAQLDKLSRGWRIENGFAISDNLAIAAARYKAALSFGNLQARLMNMREFVEHGKNNAA